MTPRRVNSTGRRRPSREPRSQLLVVCGAKRTEPAYLTGLRQAARNPAVAVKVRAHPRDPDSVIDYAMKCRELMSDDFDQVWCVLDVDQFNYSRALKTANQVGINLAISNPCFEAWLLMHHVDLTVPLQDAGAALELLKQVIPGYDKTDLNFSDFAAQVPSAIERAKLLSSDISSLGDNPSSGMWCLAELITTPDPFLQKGGISSR
jgi:hypothetical protein